MRTRPALLRRRSIPSSREGTESLYACAVPFVLQDARARSPAHLSAERRHLCPEYDGAVRYLDSQLGVTYIRLKNLGLFENTMIVITSDHGEAFGEKHLMGHGSSVYQDQVHVPLSSSTP